MSDNNDINPGDSVTDSIDSSLHVNKLLAKALNMEKINHARTTANLHRYCHDLIQRDRENAILKNSLKVVWDHVNKMSVHFLSISNEMEKVFNSTESSIQSSQKSKVNTSTVNIINDINVSFLKTPIQQTQIEQKENFIINNGNNENTESEDELQEDVEEMETERTQIYQRNRLNTLLEQTEVECTTYFSNDKPSNTNVKKIIFEESFNQRVSQQDLSLNVTQTSSCSSKLIPKRLPLAENNSMLEISKGQFSSSHNSDSGRLETEKNSSEVLEGNRRSKKFTKSLGTVEKNRTLLKPIRRSRNRIGAVTIKRPSRRNIKEFNSDEDIEMSNENENACNDDNNKIEAPVENSENQSLQETPNDVTFNTFKNIPSSTVNQTSTPLALPSTTTQSKGNFITTRRKSKLSNEDGTSSKAKPSKSLQRCSVVLERMSLSSIRDRFDSSLTTQKDLIVDEIDSSQRRPVRRTRTDKSLREPSLIKKLRRE